MQNELNNLIQTRNLNYKIPGSIYNLIDFSSVILSAHNESVKKISEFDSDINLTNTQHKKFIFHYFIYYSCEVLKHHNKKYKPVIYFDVTNKLNMQYNKYLSTFIKKFPVLLIKGNKPMKEFVKFSCEGKKDELTILLSCKLKKLQNSNFHFHKLIYFCKKYELTFLDKTYFEDIRNKLSLL